MLIKCNVIQDLLPLYVDKLTSNESNILVNSHLDDCETCCHIYNDMKIDIHNVIYDDRDPIEINEIKLINRIKKRKLISASSIFIIFSILGFLLGGLIFIQNNIILNKVEPIPLTLVNRNIVENPADYTNLESSLIKSYKVDNHSFKPGYYDIKAVGGDIEIGGIHLSEGQKHLGMQYYSNNIIGVRGDGYAQLSPSKFNKETLEDGTYTFQNQFGKYQAGVEIEPGRYELRIVNNIESPFYIFVKIDNFDEDSSNGQSFDIKDSSIYTIDINTKQFISLSNWSKEETNLTIELTKIYN